MAVGVAILGSTGSIGQSALRVLDRHATEYRVVALAAHRNLAVLSEQMRAHGSCLGVLVDGAALPAGASVPGLRIGVAALLEAATHPDVQIVINAVVGAAGLDVTLATLRAGKRLALANKESLVVAGPLVMAEVQGGPGELVPIDSEHSAILQCLTGAAPSASRRLILTASGGPFREYTREAMATITPADALQHPTWSMGRKITVDSATLVNKALEVVEGHYLFGLGYDAIEVVVHPQSIVHSMVEFVDGSVLAQLGFPTMEVPILYALTHPERLADTGTRGFDPVVASALTFEPLDEQRFPAFRLGVEAGRTGGTAPAIYNAANEVAVKGFLKGQVSFNGIAAVIDATLSAVGSGPADSLETIRSADRRAREVAWKAVEQAC